MSVMGKNTWETALKTACLLGGGRGELDSRKIDQLDPCGGTLLLEAIA